MEGLMQLPGERVPYSAIVDRPKLSLPGGGRLVVWTIVNVEEWDIERAMPRTVLPPPMGQPLQPDLPNWAWHEYGMRVGFWRFVETLKKYNLKATLAINGSVCKTYPRVANAALEAGWEFMGHGFIQRPMHHLENQREEIFKAVEAIEAFTGKKPRGWESPGITETYETIDYLREAGVEYVADWVLDDQPCEIATAFGPMVSVPYTV
jgi:allantoinase